VHLLLRLPLRLPGMPNLPTHLGKINLSICSKPPHKPDEVVAVVVRGQVVEPRPLVVQLAG
jgi:hypothetical protein